MDIDDDEFLPDLVSSDTENKLQNITTTEPEKIPGHGSSVPEEVPELGMTPGHCSPPPEEIPVPEDSPEPDNITRLAIWDTSFWTFWPKFGHKAP